MDTAKKCFEKLLKTTLTPIFAIIVASYLIWHKILGQVLLGEGYQYFPRAEAFFNANGGINTLWGFDNSARFLFDIFVVTFKDNLIYYLIFQLIIQFLIYFSFFYILKRITGSCLLAFSATIFFLANFIGSFEMFGIGNYQRFVQRIPNFIPWLFAFYFQVEFFKTGKYKFYLLSLGLFTLAVFMAHYSTFLLPIFLIYCSIWWIDQKDKLKSIIKGFLLTIPYILIDLFLIQNDLFKPTESILHFLLHEDHLINKIFYQLPINTFPSELILKLQHLHTPPDKLPPIIGSLVIPALIFYLVGFILTIKNAPSLIKLYLTTFFFALSVMFLNTYIGKVNTLVDFGTDRYFFIPSLALAVNWAIIIKSIFPKKIKLYVVGSLLVITVYLIYNFSVINYNFDLIQYKSNNMRIYIDYVKSLSLQFNKHTVIVTQPFLLWPDPMFETIYDPNLRSIPFDIGWEKRIDPNYKNDVFVIDFAYREEAGKAMIKQAGKIIDLTNQYRAGQPIEYLKY